MESTITIEKNGIILTKLANGEEEEVKAWAEQLHNTVKKTYNKYGPVRILTDISSVSFTESVGVRRQIGVMEKKNTPFVLRSAAFTQNTKVRLVAKVIARVVGRINFGVFSTKEEAQKWLDEGHIRKPKEFIISETVHMIYHLIRRKKVEDEIDALHKVRARFDYSDFTQEGNMESHVTQSGAAYVAYNYIKENLQKTEEAVSQEIRNNYPTLFSRYYKE